MLIYRFKLGSVGSEADRVCVTHRLDDPSCIESTSQANTSKIDIISRDTEERKACLDCVSNSSDYSINTKDPTMLSMIFLVNAFDIM